MCNDAGVAVLERSVAGDRNVWLCGVRGTVSVMLGTGCVCCWG